MTQLISLFVENKAEFQTGKLKRCKSLSSLSSYLFEVLKLRHLRDQPLTDKHPNRSQYKMCYTGFFLVWVGGIILVSVRLFFLEPIFVGFMPLVMC